MKNSVPNISQGVLKAAVTVLLTSVFAVVAYYVYKLNFDPAYDNRWAVADWLINYEDGGFKRRGLSGSISFLIQDLTGLSLSSVVFGSQMLFFGLMLYYLAKASLNERINLLFVSLMFTPLTLLTYVYNTASYSGRKEMIVMLTFAYMVYHLQQSTYDKKREIVVKVLLAFGVLMHELTFFYIPYFIYAEYLQTGKTSLKKIAGYLLPVLIPISVITLFGGEVDHGHTREILSNRGVIIASGGTLQHADSVNASFYITGFWSAYKWYLPAILVGFIPVALLAIQSGKKSKLKELVLFFGVALLFTSPLFFLALDWGRWIHIHFMMLLILVSMFLKKDWPDLSTNSAAGNQKRFDVIAWIIIVSSLFWKMDHCGYGINPGGMSERIWSILGS